MELFKEALEGGLEMRDLEVCWTRRGVTPFLEDEEVAVVLIISVIF